MAEGRLSGTHGEDFTGIPPTGRVVDLPVVDTSRFEGASIASHRVPHDRQDVTDQLGLEDE